MQHSRSPGAEPALARPSTARHADGLGIKRRRAAMRRLQPPVKPVAASILLVSLLLGACNTAASPPPGSGAPGGSGGPVELSVVLAGGCTRELPNTLFPAFEAANPGVTVKVD